MIWVNKKVDNYIFHIIPNRFKNWINEKNDLGYTHKEHIINLFQGCIIAPTILIFMVWGLIWSMVSIIKLFSK